MDAYKLISIVAILIQSSCLGQTNFKVTFPDSLTHAHDYYSPYGATAVTPVLIGLLNIGEPYDSIFSWKSQKFIWETDFIAMDAPDSLLTIFASQSGLKIIVDTSQEIIQDQYFSESFNDDSGYTNPRYIKMISKTNRVKTIAYRKEMKLRFAAMPVYIVNATDSARHVYVQDFNLHITQEVLDKQGAWREVEHYITGFCGVAWGWKTMYPNQFILSSVLKYKGDFNTLARIKFDNGTVYYSQPYSISINADILSKKTRLQ